MLTFGQKLREYRLSRDMKLDELAELLGTTKQVLSRYENEKRVPKVTVVAQYADQLGLPLAALMPDEGEPEKREAAHADNDIRCIIRARGKMTARDRERMMSILRTAFEKEFADES
jgi:transcriptional regulator with XRE-family HTH domain